MGTVDWCCNQIQQVTQVPLIHLNGTMVRKTIDIVEI